MSRRAGLGPAPSPTPILRGMPPGPSAADELVLAGEFPAADRDRWLAAVAAALDRKGGLTPEAAMARLRSTTYDGITIEPLYTAEDAPDPAAAGVPGHPPYVRGRTAARGRRSRRRPTPGGTSASSSTPPPGRAGR